MFIQTEETPNPNALKFLPGLDVAREASVHILRDDPRASEAFAAKLFLLSGVEAVYLGADFITVTKSEEQSWAVLKGQVLAAIADYAAAQRPWVAVSVGSLSENEADPVVRQIRELIETRVRPAVAMDGGEISFESFENGVVYVHLRGSCAGCPSSSVTLKSGIEGMLRHYVPEVLEVRAVAAGAPL